MPESDAPEKSEISGGTIYLIFTTTSTTKSENWEASCLKGDVDKLVEFIRALIAKGRTVHEVFLPAGFHQGFVGNVNQSHGPRADPEFGLELVLAVRKAKRIVKQGNRLPEEDWIPIAKLIHPEPDVTVEV